MAKYTKNVQIDIRKILLSGACQLVLCDKKAFFMDYIFKIRAIVTSFFLFYLFICFVVELE